MKAPNPADFAPEAVDPETRAFNARLTELFAHMPSAHTLPPQVTRDAREAGLGAFGPILRSQMAVDRTIPGPAGEIPVRVSVPDSVQGVYLHFHGGGWVLGRPHHNDLLNEAIARTANLAVVSVDYRLSPEHPYPAGPDDCEAAARWLLQNAQAEFGTERLLIGGESAGAHLSAVTLLRLRDSRRKQGEKDLQGTGFVGASLVYGAYDLTMTPSQRLWQQNLVLSPPLLRWFSDCFVPKERRHEPDVSPLFADVSGLPKTLFTVGTLDPLLDDTLFMYSRFLAAGNPAELAVYPGGVHGFNLFPCALGRRANEHMANFLKGVI